MQEILTFRENVMRRCLGIAAVLFFGFGAACGDLSEIDDNRIREFVKTAKRVIIDELMVDGNTQDEIDDKIGVIVEVLQGDSGGGTTTPPGDGGGTPPAVPACRETGRKTVVMFRDAAGHIGSFLADPSGFNCDILATSTTCVDGDDICSCQADDALNPSGSTTFAVTCTEDGGSGETFSFTDAETTTYDAPSGGGGGTTPPGGGASAYSISESNQNQKAPGIIFPITVVNNSGATVTPAAQASLSAYNSSGSEIADALATWKTTVGENIYDISVGAGNKAEFIVFLVRDTSGVAKIGGTVDGTPINKVTLTAGTYTGVSDILAINDTQSSSMTFMFSGTARTSLNSASKAMTYVITDANGEVQASETATLRGLDVPGTNGKTFVTSTAGSCNVGEYVLIRIGVGSSKVYLVRCQAQSN